MRIIQLSKKLSKFPESESIVDFITTLFLTSALIYYFRKSFIFLKFQILYGFFFQN